LARYQKLTDYKIMSKKKTKKNGRPTKYNPKFCGGIIKFFEVKTYETATEKFYYKNGGVKEKEIRIPVGLPFLSAFARSIGVCHDTLCEWCKVHPKFSEAYKIAKELQKEMLINNGLMGLYPAAAYIFTAKNIAGMRDAQELTGKDGGPLQVQVIDGYNVKNTPNTNADPSSSV